MSTKMKIVHSEPNTSGTSTATSTILCTTGPSSTCIIDNTKKQCMILGNGLESNPRIPSKITLVKNH